MPTVISDWVILYLCLRGVSLTTINGSRIQNKKDTQLPLALRYQQTGCSNTTIQQGHPSHLCPPRSRPTIITPSVWWYYSVPVRLSETGVSDQSAALDEIPAVCAPLMTRRNDGPHLKQRWAIKRNGVGRRILVVLTDIAGRGEPFFVHCFFYFLLSARERRWDHRVIAVYYSARNVQVRSDFYTFEGTGLIKDTLIKIWFRILCVFVVAYVYLLYLTCFCCTMCVLLFLI